MKLRKLTIEDLPTRVQWMNTPAVYKTMHFEIPITLEKTIVWYENNLNNPRRCDVVLLEDDRIVAFAGITNIDPIIKKGESYTFVNPEMQGKGIGTKARQMVLDYAFGELGLNKVFAYTNVDNVVSCKLSEKLGFKLEGVFRKEYITADGELKDRLYYGLLKDEWIHKTY